MRSAPRGPSARPRSPPAPHASPEAFIANDSPRRNSIAPPPIHPATAGSIEGAAQPLTASYFPIAPPLCGNGQCAYSHLTHATAHTGRHRETAMPGKPEIAALLSSQSACRQRRTPSKSVGPLYHARASHRDPLYLYIICPFFGGRLEFPYSPGCGSTN